MYHVTMTLFQSTSGRLLLREIERNAAGNACCDTEIKYDPIYLQLSSNYVWVPYSPSTPTPCAGQWRPYLVHSGFYFAMAHACAEA